MTDVSWGRVVEQKLKLSSNFGCDKIRKIWSRNAVLLKADLDVQQTHQSGTAHISYVHFYAKLVELRLDWVNAIKRFLRYDSYASTLSISFK